MAPPIVLAPRLQALLDRANQELGRLDGITTLLPDPQTLLYTYVRKEAVLSSQIEGTQSSLSDLLLFENEAAPGVPIGDVAETANYITAMSHGIDSVRGDRLPVSARLLREVHGLLLDGVRGTDKAPGAFRRDQNRIGGSSPSDARFVPPPWNLVPDAIGNLERYLHDAEEPLLVRVGVAHAQFETIHPFLDGNGRVGRLLITLVLCAEGVLREPLLYLSLYFKQHRDEYYERLQRVRTHGEWEEWLGFFLRGIAEVARTATDTTARIVQMIERDRARISQVGRGAASALRVHEIAVRSVVLTPRRVGVATGLTDPPIYAAFRRLEDLGVLTETTGRQRGKVWAYAEYLSILNEGTG
ncbi:MAG: filamentation induced by cAMP protein Fic [Solirubrobacterales bacterium]|nr:filamentation induced by cAMP protein Fic [Solirubrobacterales bacterium]